MISSRKTELARVDFDDFGQRIISTKDNHNDACDSHGQANHITLAALFGTIIVEECDPQISRSPDFTMLFGCSTFY